MHRWQEGRVEKQQGGKGDTVKSRKQTIAIGCPKRARRARSARRCRRTLRCWRHAGRVSASDPPDLRSGCRAAPPCCVGRPAAAAAAEAGAHGCCRVEGVRFPKSRWDALAWQGSCPPNAARHLLVAGPRFSNPRASTGLRSCGDPQLSRRDLAPALMASHNKRKFTGFSSTAIPAKRGGTVDCSKPETKAKGILDRTSRSAIG